MYYCPPLPKAQSIKKGRDPETRTEILKMNTTTSPYPFRIEFCFGERKNRTPYFGIYNVVEFQEFVRHQIVDLIRNDLQLELGSYTIWVEGTFQGITAQVELHDLTEIFFKQLKDVVTVYLGVKVNFYPYGSGISKRNKVLLTSFQVLMNESLEDMMNCLASNWEVQRKMHSDFALYFNTIYRQSQEIKSIRDILRVPVTYLGRTPTDYRSVFLLPLQAKYSKLTKEQILTRMNFDQYPDIDSFEDYHNYIRRARLTKVIDESFDKSIQDYLDKLDPSSLILLEKETSLTTEALQYISKNFPPSKSFHERVCRQIIDRIVHGAIWYGNKSRSITYSGPPFSLAVEETLFSDQNLPRNSLGYGPLDYFVRSTVPVPLVIAPEEMDIDPNTRKSQMEESDEDEDEDEDESDIEAEKERPSSGLFQLLGQLHDCLLISQADRHKEDPSWKYENSEATGVLCNGHTWEFYRVVRVQDEGKSTQPTKPTSVLSLGKANMKVLRYLNGSLRVTRVISKNLQSLPCFL